MTKASSSRSQRRAGSKTDDYAQVEARLPRLMRLAFDAYCARASAPESGNDTEFVAGQAACRASLAHFMLIAYPSGSGATICGDRLRGDMVEH